MKTLFTTTFLITLMTTGAFAQDGRTSQDVFGHPSVAVRDHDRYLVASKGLVLTSGLVGQTVYNGPADDAATIGEVTDIVLSPDGNAVAALIGVGGFLGVGQKDIAVSLDQLAWVTRDDNKRWLVVASSKEELSGAPTFDSNSLLRDGASDPAKGQATGVATNAKTESVVNKAASDIRSALKAVPTASISSEKLIGSAVYGPDEKQLGSVADTLMAGDGQVDAFVVDVGGFLGLGKKPIAISIENLDLLADDNGKISVFTPFTKDELEKHPAYSAEAYKADSEKILLRGAAE
ncbi:PRC-barrel domain-containing protein [Phyllobacterium zundukense]|uniref:PRC-barrel domain-containing protein n=1 Tax=Phyllobacterium zundukense TaxID=1867719 RepID=UPI000C67A716|nr:PRC-barrel domain-containing protein [Phyllobacterium zundukense]ATU94549.1 photosystem reaction center subunit H [Phyllobacterium zundukense]